MAKTKPQTTKLPKSVAVQAAADRAEKRLRGEAIDSPKADIDPAIVRAVEMKKGADTSEKLGGRPSDYDPSYAILAAKLCYAGATNPELADIFDVSTRTIDRWIVQHEEFRRAVKGGRQHPDDRVERSLYHKAMGYEVEEIVPMKVKTVIYEDGKRVKEEEKIEMVKTKRVIPAETQAAMFWLKNRRKDEWQELTKREVGAPGDFDTMSDEELTNHVEKQYAEIAKLKKTRGGSSKTEH